MERIMVTPESSYHAIQTEIERIRVPVFEKEELLQKLEIKIQPYYHKSGNGITCLSFIPVYTLIQRFNMAVTSCPGDIAWFSRMAFETEAKSSDAQAPIMERLYEINPQRVWHGEVGHRVPANHECSLDTRQFQHHIYDHNRVPEIVHGSTHDDNLLSAIVE